MAVRAIIFINYDQSTRAPYRPAPGQVPRGPEGLPQVPARSSRASAHRGGLSEVLTKLDEGTLTSGEAVQGLRHCAALIRDDNLPYGWDESLSHEMGYEVLKGLLRTALGKSPGSYKAKTTVPVGEGGGPVVEQVSAIMGVLLDLDTNRRLVSVSIHPGKYRKRREVMAIVGIGSDPNPDVALRHDDYLAMQDPHSNA